MNRLSRQVLFLLGLVLLPDSLNASAPELTPTLYFFNYQEFDQSDQLLDKEQGVIPGLRLDFNPLQRFKPPETHVSLYGGRVNYTGQTQAGSPHKTETIEQILNLGVSLHPGYLSEIHDNIFLGMQYWYWDRDILTRNNVLGLHEIYSWYELELGYKMETGDDPSSPYWLQVSAIHTLAPEMKLRLPSSTVKLDLGSKPGFRIRAGKKWENGKGWFTSINLLLEYWGFGRSNSVFTNDFFGQSGFITEPRSESFHSGVEFNLRFRF